MPRVAPITGKSDVPAAQHAVVEARLRSIANEADGPFCESLPALPSQLYRIVISTRCSGSA